MKWLNSLINNEIFGFISNFLFVFGILIVTLWIQYRSKKPLIRAFRVAGIFKAPPGTIQAKNLPDLKQELQNRGLLTPETEKELDAAISRTMQEPRRHKNDTQLPPATTQIPK